MRIYICTDMRSCMQTCAHMWLHYLIKPHPNQGPDERNPAGSSEQRERERAFHNSLPLPWNAFTTPTRRALGQLVLQQVPPWQLAKDTSKQRVKKMCLYVTVPVLYTAMHMYWLLHVSNLTPDNTKQRLCLVKIYIYIYGTTA